MAQPDTIRALQPIPGGTVRVVWQALARDLGLTTMFGNPGSTELPMLKDFPDDFTYVLGLQESVVVAMADGYAKATGGAALVNLHTAAGLGNAMGAVVTAHHGRSPLVITAGNQDRRMLESEPFLSGRLVELAEPYVKWSHEPARAADVPDAFERAYHMALAAPRGPVFLSIPMDDWDVEVPAHPRRELSYRTAPDPEALDRVAEILRHAERPAIVAGADVDRSEGWEPLRELAERLQAGVFGEAFGGQAGFPERHPLFQGFLPPGQAPLAERLESYDVVLVVGAPVFRYYPYVPGPTVAEGTQVVQLTSDPDEAARALLGLSVVGDPALASAGLLERLSEPSDREAPEPRPAPEPPEPAEPMPTAFVFHTLSERLPSGAVLVEESPSSKQAFQLHLPTKEPGGFYTTPSGGLGHAMPAAVGLALGDPGRKVVCVIGEGSAMYAIQALWTAARHGAAVLFIVMDNSQYGILKSFGELLETGPKVPGLDVEGLDMLAIARGMGCRAERVELAADLAGALDRGLAADGPVLLDVLVDPAVTSLL